MPLQKYALLLSLPFFMVACSANKSLPESTETGQKPAFEKYNGDTDIFKNDKRLAIASFRVIFITGGAKREIAADTGRWGSTGKAESTATIKTRLKNVDSATMQRITDQAYGQFRYQLEKSGFSVLEDKQVEESKAFSEIKKRDAGGEFDASLNAKKTNIADFPTFSPSGLALLDSSFFCKQVEPVLANNCLAKVANDLGVTVLHVLQVVDFSSFDARSVAGKNYFTKEVYASAKVSSGQNIHLIPRYTGVNAVTEKGKHLTLILAEENPYQGAKAFGESVEATSTGDKVASGIGNVLGFLSGVSGGKARSNSTVTYDIQAKPEIYQAMVVDMLDASGAEIAWTLKQYSLP